MLGTEGKCTSGHLQDKFLQLCQKIAQASAVKQTIEKPILFIFVNLSTKLCLRLEDCYSRLIPNPHLFEILPSKIVGYCTVLVAVTHWVLQHSQPLSGERVISNNNLEFIESSKTCCDFIKVSRSTRQMYGLTIYFN